MTRESGFKRSVLAVTGTAAVAGSIVVEMVVVEGFSGDGGLVYGIGFLVWWGREIGLCVSVVYVEVCWEVRGRERGWREREERVYICSSWE